MLRALYRLARRSLRQPDAPELRHEFARWARPWTVLFLALMAVVYGGIILVALWPLDLVLLSEAQRGGFALLRLANVFVSAACLYALSTRWARRHLEGLAGATLLAYTALGAWNAAVLPHDPFYWPGVFAPLGVSVMLLPLGRRVVWTIAVGALHNVAWYARDPSALKSPTTLPSLALYLTAVVIAIAFGNGVYDFAWRVFLAQREIRRFNQRLEGDVRDKTSEIRRLAQRVERLHEDEKRRLASELHDELGQSLTALRLEAAMLERGADPKTAARALHGQLDELFESVRWLVSSLRPKALEERGLVAGCEWLVERFELRTGVDVAAHFDEIDGAGAAASLTLFRVLQESLTNVARHAEAKRVSVSLRRYGDAVLLRVEDDGRGIPPGSPAGNGLSAMRERALAIGARLTIEPGNPGTTIALTVPLEAAPPGATS